MNQTQPVPAAVTDERMQNLNGTLLNTNVTTVVPPEKKANTMEEGAVE